jgi:hypothetical protein
MEVLIDNRMVSHKDTQQNKNLLSWDVEILDSDVMLEVVKELWMFQNLVPNQLVMLDLL